MANNAQQILINAFQKASIKKSMGMELEFNHEGQAIFRWPYNPNFNHSFGVHGSIFATLLDNAGWFTSAAHHNQWVVTVEFQTRLLEGVKEEGLYSIGRIIRAGKRITVCDMQVFTEKERLVATGSGTFAVMPTPLTELEK